MRRVVLVCGGRDFADYELLWAILNDLNIEQQITCVVHGRAKGADDYAEKWAEAHSIGSIGYAANWKEHGNAAGPIRNRVMLEDARPDLVVAFPGGKGTAHMVKIARDAGVEVRQIFPASPREITRAVAPQNQISETEQS